MNTFIEATLNGWWQGIALTLLVSLVLREARRINAATKVAIWQITLAVVILLPAALWIAARTPAKYPEAAHVASPTAVEQRATLPAAVNTNAVWAPQVQPPLVEVSDRHPLELLFAVALFLALVQWVRLLFGSFWVFRLKRSARPSAIANVDLSGRNARVLLSDKVGMPMAVGYRHPAILLPSALPAKLTAEELNYVLLHESAHLRRHDDWMTLAESAIRAVFCFQPAVYWILAQIRREREIACDDHVLAQAGAATSYAGALARLAEIGSCGRVPLLATGAGRTKQIFARLETLLDCGRNRLPQVSGTAVLLTVVILAGATFQGSQLKKLFGIPDFSSRWVTSDGTNRREVRMRGELEFSRDDKDVESMSPGALLVVEKTNGWNTRRLEFESGEGAAVLRRYFSHGAQRPFDAEARQFAAAILPAIALEQGRDIPVRVSRLLREGGADGALNQIRSINGGTKRLYMEELLRQAEFKPDELRYALRIAGQFGSDDDRRQFFETIQARYPEAGLDAEMFALIDRVHSDEVRRDMLTRMLENSNVSEASMVRISRSAARMSSDEMKADVLGRAAQGFHNSLPQEFFDALGAIHSDHERERLLLTLLTAHGKEPVTLAAVLRNAAGMSSDEAKANIVVGAAPEFHGDAEALLSVEAVLSSIHSDGDRRRAMERLLEADEANPETLRAMLAQTAKISSDEEKRRLLLRAANALKDVEPVSSAFFAAWKTVHSTQDQRQVLLAVLSRQDLDAVTLNKVTQAAAQMPSQEDQLAVLKAIAVRR